MLSCRPKILFASCFLFLCFVVSGCGGVGALSEVRVTPYTAEVAPGQTQQFTATGYDSSGNPISVTAAWSVVGSLGTIDAQGLFYAGAATGSCYVLATAAGISGQAQATITDKGAISGKVRNAAGSNVSGITVRLSSDHSKSAETNSSGNYSLSSLSAGTHQVETVATVRYLSSSSEVTVAAAQTTTLNFTLSDRLSIATSVLTRVGTTMNISGTVRNNGTSTTAGGSVVYAFYDEENWPMGNGAASLGTINAGSTEAFVMIVTLSKAQDPSRTDSYAVAGGY